MQDLSLPGHARCRIARKHAWQWHAYCLCLLSIECRPHQISPPVRAARSGHARVSCALTDRSVRGLHEAWCRRGGRNVAEHRPSGRQVPSYQSTGLVVPSSLLLTLQSSVLSLSLSLSQSKSHRPLSVLVSLSPVPGRAMSYNKAPSITAETINPRVKIFSYAPCGEILKHAERLEQEMEENPGSLPFQEIIYCNLGNPQVLGQPPLTFFREVLSLCDNPTLLNRDETCALFSPYSIRRARRIINKIPNKDTGGYTDSQGIKWLRQVVADGITGRDGFPSNADDIFLTDGASSAINLMMQILIRSHEDGILSPLPEYPLYSASIILNGGTMVPYNLTEDNGWGLEIFEVKRCLEEARSAGLTVRAMVVINPGNPTGQVLSITNQEEIVEFCRKEGLVILADEVYQENIYAENKKFNSFKKVARSLGYDENDLSLVSFNSVSMSYGESGRRGGYMEVTGLAADVKYQMCKVASLTICPNIAGQILISLAMDPPKLGDESFELFDDEKEKIRLSFWKRAKTLEKAFSSMEGVSCNKLEGALYLFPRLHLPSAAIRAAESKGVSPDTFYAHRLLDATGIAVVPGSGFHQESGSIHIRCTILPDEGKIASMIPRLCAFHKAFMNEFRGSQQRMHDLRR